MDLIKRNMFQELRTNLDTKYRWLHEVYIVELKKHISSWLGCRYKVQTAYL